MADPRLNSMHLEDPRRQDYRRAREALLHARGYQTLAAEQKDLDVLKGGPDTIDAEVAPEDAPGLRFWLVDRDSVYPLKVGLNTIGRSPDNDIVVPDMLASRHHARLVITVRGVQIQDTSSNGTFVNGRRVKDAVVRENDVVTIGNVDLVVVNGALVRRQAPAVASGGLEVRDVSVAIGGKSALLDDVSLSAKPGTLTAVIGPSGSGKSAFLTVIAGTTRPRAGTVALDGHDVHGEYASLRNRIGMVPRGGIVHRHLTVEQALSYAAELRMSPDTIR